MNKAYEEEGGVIEGKGRERDREQSATKSIKGGEGWVGGGGKKSGKRGLASLQPSCS